MGNLTDLEICKRIAEIENLMFCTGGRYKRIEIWKNGKVFKYEKYNPLTDDALWVQLIIKHEVSINFNFCLLNITTDKFYEKNFHDIEDLKARSLELIIEANNG